MHFTLLILGFVRVAFQSVPFSELEICTVDSSVKFMGGQLEKWQRFQQGWNLYSLFVLHLNFLDHKVSFSSWIYPFSQWNVLIQFLCFLSAAPTIFKKQAYNVLKSKQITTFYYSHWYCWSSREEVTERLAFFRRRTQGQEWFHQVVPGKGSSQTFLLKTWDEGLWFFPSFSTVCSDSYDTEKTEM